MINIDSAFGLVMQNERLNIDHSIDNWSMHSWRTFEVCKMVNPRRSRARPLLLLRIVSQVVHGAYLYGFSFTRTHS